MNPDRFQRLLFKRSVARRKAARIAELFAELKRLRPRPAKRGKTTLKGRSR